MYTKAVNAIIFDFDGTIANSFDEVLAFMLKVSRKDLAQLGLEKQDLKSLSMKDLALKVGVPWWRLPLLYFEGKRVLKKRMHTVPVFDGMSEVLKSLHDEQYRLYIISSNSRSNINRFLAENGLSGYFIKVYGNAGWFGKASILRRALKKNKLEADKTVYVGDEVRDVIGAKLAGMPCIAVNWGFGSESNLLQYNPTVLVRTPGELQKALVDWGKSV